MMDPGEGQNGMCDDCVTGETERQEREEKMELSLIHISEPTRQAEISYAVFCLKKKKTRDSKRQDP